MLTIAHRGASGIAPENTLLAFRLALEQGADAIELDVFRCASGELVVIHDETLERTTNGVGKVREQPLGALRKLDAGEGEHIPTLSEVVEVVGRRVPIFIELKHSSLAKDVAVFLQHYLARGWNYDDLIVIGDFYDELYALKRLVPSILIGAGMEKGGVKKMRALCKRLHPYAILPHYALVDALFVTAVSERKVKLFPWTVNKPQDLNRLQKLGVDGIITDYPDRIKKQPSG